ncbi:MAG: hypothetical protein CVT98_07780 [Bacteroidetes bacterium HGW-Bacteroidetes-15]|nr:MAG: hypothetical protein CVT98_07780 [Bacteroidetes bacterium HGW-Bacteroidetes-15]
MSTLNVILWFNEENTKSNDFAKTFIDDLQKCFVRFGQAVNLQSNPTDEMEGKHFIILSAADSSSTKFFSKCKNATNNPETKLLLLDPIENIDLTISKSSQPILFWDKLYATDEIRLFRRDISESQAKYWEKVIDIVVELNDQYLKDSAIPKREKVYLSQDIISYNAESENLKRDLNDLGFDVLPNVVLSNSIDECTSQILNALESARLIIHFIPPIYNSFFVNQQLSLAEHQCNISADYLEKINPKPGRIIWIPSAYEITDEENQVFVEKIQRDEKQTKGTMILKSSIEDLKKYYRKVLQGDGTLKSEADHKNDVYIVMDSDANGNYKSVVDTFKGRNLSVDINYTGITYNQHLAKLAAAKIVVVCYGSENEQWLKVKVNDIQKSKGIDSYQPYEQLYLLKANSSLDVKSYESFFTQVLHDTKAFLSL